MKRFDHGRSGFMAPAAALLAVLLISTGAIATASRSGAAKTQLIKIVGVNNTTWDKTPQAVTVGDTIEWVIGKGKHGVEFTSDCEAAKEALEFDKQHALKECKSEESATKGTVLLKAKLIKPLTKDLNYRCSVHLDQMTGKLTP